MGDSPGTTSQEIPFQGMYFVSPTYGVVGPPFMATLSLHGLNIGLHVWLFSNPVIPNAPFVLVHGPSPHEHRPHVNPSPSSSNVESTSLSSSSHVGNSDVSKRVAKKKMKRKDKKKKTKQSELKPTEVFVVSSDFSMQEEMLYLSTEPSPSSEFISFNLGNLSESHLHSSVPFQISM